MKSDTIRNTLVFLKEAERLKDVLRNSHTSSGRHESVAEHTWRLCLMAMVFEEDFGAIDMAKLLKICILHDLGEAIGGDVPAIDQRPDMNKAATERADLLTLLAPLEPALRDQLTALWEEYDGGTSPEARLVKGLDKLETIMQHNQGRNSADFDYDFNLSYGKKYTSHHPLLAEIRACLDEETAQKAAHRQP